MAKPTITQQQHPWLAVIRTVFAAVLALALLAPALYTAITNADPAAATGFAAIALAVAGAITRVMALPGVNVFLARFLPFLAPAPRSEILQGEVLSSSETYDDPNQHRG